MLMRTASNDVTFTYPSTSGTLSNRNTLLKRSMTRSMVSDVTYSNNDYAENMSIVAVSDQMEPGDKILAYVDGSLRGVSDAVDMGEKQLNFISVAGENRDRDVSFELERNGDVIARAKTTFSYQANAVLGTLAQPVELDFSTPKDNISVYPNPFIDKLNIHVVAQSGDIIEIAVYDVLGRLIMKRAQETVTGNFFHTTWNGIVEGNSTSAPGIYLVHVTLNGETSVYKVEKQ